jgi:hypothetical protein
MNKLLLSNFLNLSQRVTGHMMNDHTTQFSFVHGFDVGLYQGEIVYPRLASGILQAILVHDVIAIELHNIYELVHIFGFPDAMKLLQSDGIEIVNHGGLNPILRQKGTNYEVMFATDGEPGQSKAYLNRIEKHLRRDFPANSNEINALLLQTEAHQKLFDRKDSTDNSHKPVFVKNFIPTFSTAATAAGQRRARAAVLSASDTRAPDKSPRRQRP